MNRSSNEIPSALDVAERILQLRGPISAKKLLKLVYYCQAWSLAVEDRSMFRERVEAWMYGPVVPDLYQVHPRGIASTVDGDPTRLDARDGRIIERVLLYYGHLNGNRLGELSHGEAPWKDARGGLPDNKPSSKEITCEAMRDFYKDRPWGTAQPVADAPSFSIDRIQEARADIAAGRSRNLDTFERELRANRS